MAIRWIQTTRVSLQRAGTLLAVVTAAPDRRGTTIEALARSSSALLTTKLSISREEAQHVAVYVRRMHLWRRYQQLRDLTPDGLVDKKIEAQDLWLADPKVPSASGAITERVTEEPAQLAIALRMVRAENHTLTDRGKALRLAAPEQVAALRGDSSGTNPMVLPSGAGLLVLHSLVLADYDFLRATHRVAIPDSRGAFTRTEVSAKMAEVCLIVRDEGRRQVRTGEDRQRLTRLAELAESIRDADKAPTSGGARPPDQTSTVRLEPYVDLGLLNRLSRFEYQYSISAGQRAFYDSIKGEESALEWAAAEMVGRYAAARNPALVALDPADHWVEIRQAWMKLRSAMGYASIDEALLVVNAGLIDTGTGYFELRDGLTALRALQKSAPKSIRFTMARGGAVSYFKFTDSGVSS